MPEMKRKIIFRTPSFEFCGGTVEARDIFTDDVLDNFTITDIVEHIQRRYSEDEFFNAFNDLINEDELIREAEEMKKTYDSDMVDF